MSKPKPPIDPTALDGLRNVLQVSELFARSPYAQLAEKLGRDLQAQIDAWRESWTRSFKALAEGIELNERALAPRARQLGEMGWTIPMWASLEFVPRILQEAGSEEIDAAFVQLYTYKRRKHFIQMFKGLEDRAVLGRWIGMLRDCRWAYYRKKYRLAVPSLLLVLDGLLSIAGDTWEKNESPKKITARLASQSKVYDLSIWHSIDGFVQQIFKHWRFSDPRPPIINRHWILHGRDVPNWTQADCLRLFQAIDTLSCVVDFGVKDSREDT